MAEQVDEITGMSQLVVVDSPDEKRQPMIQVKGPAGSRRYLMPTHAHVMVILPVNWRFSKPWR